MIYIRVNKAASTSISEFVKGTCQILHYTTLTNRRDRMRGWMDRCNIKHQDSFTVVRDPYTRAISMYHHCRRLGFKYSIIDWLKKDLCAMAPHERAHSMRQVDYLRNHKDEIIPSYIFTMEDPALEQKIQEITGIEWGMPHLAKGSYTPMDLNPEARKLIELKYYMDFITFNYKTIPDG